jgi:hypothetical protein
MANSAIPIPVWHTPTYAAFLAANPHLHNHSSRTVLDPELPVAYPVEEVSNTPAD